MSAAHPPSCEDRGARLGQLLSLLALTGFAISQPLLAVAGENPTLFTFAGMEGGDLVVFALLVALLPPLLLWLLVLAAGLVRRRLGDGLFLLAAGVLAGAAVAQWAWSAGLEARWARWLVWAAAGIGAAVLLARVAAVRLWSRYAAPLPALSVVLFLAASPSSDLLARPEEAAAAATGDHPPVVFVLLDELPLVSLLDDDGSIDEVRFPNLAGFAATSTWYRNYTVNAPNTHFSVPSILSGKAPGDWPPIWTVHPDNLFSLLAPTHELVVAESLTRLCGFESCSLDGIGPSADGGTASVLGQMVDVWRERVGLLPGEGPDLGQFAPEVVPLDPEAPGAAEQPPGLDVVARPTQATAFLEALDRTTSTSLAYLHLMLPHQPWKFAPDGRPFDGLDPPGLLAPASQRDPSRWDLALMQQSHLYQLQYADRLVGEVLQHLRDTGRFDDAVVVVTADHGISFSEDGPLRRLTEGRVAEIAYVPLLVKAPGQTTGSVDDRNVQGVDLLPTLADLVGVEIPWEVDGRPACELPPDPGGPKVIMDFSSGTFAPQSEPSLTIEFTASEHRPSADLRLVGPVEEGEHPLAGLLRLIDADRWLGVPVDELGSPPTAGRATLRRALPLVTDAEGTEAVGVVRGTVAATAAGSTMLLALDGAIESAAPVDDEGRFKLMVDPGAPRGEGTRLDLFRLDPDGSLVRVEVELE